MDTLYDRVGGEEFFTTLIEHFYAGVVGDPVLRPLYPEDLTASKAHLAMFLVQYWGGPREYQDVRGHPRLRMRHAPFVIGDPERDAWLRHMRAAVDRADVSGEDREDLLAYFEMAADQLVNAR